MSEAPAKASDLAAAAGTRFAAALCEGKHDGQVKAADVPFVVNGEEHRFCLMCAIVRQERAR